MMEKITAIIIAIVGVFSLGFFRGKNSQNIKQLKNSYEMAIKSKKRQAQRKNDDIITIKQRMYKYLRK